MWKHSPRISSSRLCSRSARSGYACRLADLASARRGAGTPSTGRQQAAWLWTVRGVRADDGPPNRRFLAVAIPRVHLSFLMMPARRALSLDTDSAGKSLRVRGNHRSLASTASVWISVSVRSGLNAAGTPDEADDPPLLGDAGRIRPPGRALVPACQQDYDPVHEERRDECQQDHDDQRLSGGAPIPLYLLIGVCTQAGGAQHPV